MADDLQWTSESWSAAIAALPSVNKLLALYEGGAVARLEILEAVYEYCHDKPEVAAELVQVFRDHTDESIRFIGKWLEDLLRQKDGDRI
ncbi:MAG TPA: hypothetical protein VMF69_09420 [Gemmataceae bacterium]|nr:hypothetical protein [Gemmataceae bacterium]